MCRLPRERASADAVVLLGPFYHLMERYGRRLALYERLAAWSDRETRCWPRLSRASPLRWTGSHAFLAESEFEVIAERDVGRRTAM
jgi:hypothetical protein